MERENGGSRGGLDFANMTNPPSWSFVVTLLSQLTSHISNDNRHKLYQKCKRTALAPFLGSNQALPKVILSSLTSSDECSDVHKKGKSNRRVPKFSSVLPPKLLLLSPPVHQRLALDRRLRLHPHQGRHVVVLKASDSLRQVLV